MEKKLPFRCRKATKRLAAWILDEGGYIVACDNDTDVKTLRLVMAMQQVVADVAKLGAFDFTEDLPAYPSTKLVKATISAKAARAITELVRKADAILAQK